MDEWHANVLTKEEQAIPDKTEVNFNIHLNMRNYKNDMEKYGGYTEYTNETRWGLDIWKREKQKSYLDNFFY